jgi:hypothetical protein
MRRSLPFALALLRLALPHAAGAATFLPPAGKLYAGVTAGEPQTYEQETGAHAAIFQEFITWGGTIDWALTPADQNRSRAMLAIQTITPSGGEVISPGAIARGQGDGWLEWLGGYLAQRGQPGYVRLFAEMDAYWNPYSAYNQNGSFRGRDHSTHAFKQAWWRITLILRGGPVAAVRVDPLARPGSDRDVQPGLPADRKARARSLSRRRGGDRAAAEQSRVPAVHARVVGELSSC